MTASVAFAAKGTTYSWNGVAIAEITSFGFPSPKTDLIEVTHTSSPGNWKEFIAGLIDGGEFSIKCNVVLSDTTGQIAMYADYLAGTARTVLITGPSSNFTQSFTALITAMPMSGSLTTQMSWDISLKVTGLPTLSIAASNNGSALTVTTATLYPVFAAGTYAYTATTTGVSVTVTLTFAAGTATATAVTSTGVTTNATLTSTVASSALTIGAINTVTVLTIVVTETGKVAKTYVINIAKTA